jgi:hypothetical protein
VTSWFQDLLFIKWVNLYRYTEGGSLKFSGEKGGDLAGPMMKRKVGAVQVECSYPIAWNRLVSTLEPMKWGKPGFKVCFFKFFKLYRYSEVSFRTAILEETQLYAPTPTKRNPGGVGKTPSRLAPFGGAGTVREIEVGLHKLNPLDPKLESYVSTLEPRKWSPGFKACFQIQLVPLRRGGWVGRRVRVLLAAEGAAASGGGAACVQVECSCPICSLKASGFNPWAYQVISWFPNFAFKWFNLYRYAAGRWVIPPNELKLGRRIGRAGTFHSRYCCASKHGSIDDSQYNPCT